MLIAAMVARIAAGARVERALHMRYAGDFFGPGHAHPRLHHLDFLDQGRTVVRVAGRTQPLQSGQVVFVRAGRHHGSVESAPAPIFDVFSVSFHLDDCPSWPLVMPMTGRDDVRAAFRVLIDEFLAERSGCDLFLRIHLAQLFLQLWRGGHPLPGASVVVLPAARQEVESTRDKMKQAVEFIHAHYAEKTCMRDIAATIHVSVSCLSHNFKRETGLAPAAYLIRYRLEKALWLMDKTAHKIATIAEMTGFASAHYFYRLFKKHYKMSPRKYRLAQKHQGDEV